MKILIQNGFLLTVDGNYMSNSNNKFISIIVATKNVEDTILSLFKSLRKQTSDNFELIIIDAQSADMTIQIIKRNIDIVTKFISEPDQGISDAWNKGIKLSKGKWLLFLGGDDTLCSNKVIENSILKLRSVEKSISIVYGQVNTVNHLGKVIQTIGDDWKKVKKRNRTTMAIPHQATFHKRDLFKKIGFFNIKFLYAADYEFLIRALKNQNPMHLSGHIVSNMMIGGLSTNPQLQCYFYYEFRKARIENNINNFDLLWIWLFFKSIIKMIISKILGVRFYDLIYKTILKIF